MQLSSSSTYLFWRAKNRNSSNRSREVAAKTREEMNEKYIRKFMNMRFRTLTFVSEDIDTIQT